MNASQSLDFYLWAYGSVKSGSEVHLRFRNLGSKVEKRLQWEKLELKYLVRKLLQQRRQEMIKAEPKALTIETDVE